MLRNGILTIGLIVCFGIVSQMDADDADNEQTHYCEMVTGGYWPDFKDIFDEVCK